ncbi:MAG: hypothetical protein ACMG57_03625 [Candidatus Dojkabacteria bacterium]
MALDPKLMELADKVRSALAGRSGLEEKTLFGGLNFSLNGNMVASVNSQGFSLRVGTDHQEEALKMSGVKQKMLGVKPMNGMIMADESRYTDEGVKEIVNFAADIVAAMPAKEKKA